MYPRYLNNQGTLSDWDASGLPFDRLIFGEESRVEKGNEVGTCAIQDLDKASSSVNMTIPHL